MCTVCLICRNTAKTTTETSTKINMVVHGVHRTIGNDGWFQGLILAQHPETFREANYGRSMALFTIQLAWPWWLFGKYDVSISCSQQLIWHFPTPRMVCRSKIDPDTSRHQKWHSPPNKEGKGRASRASSASGIDSEPQQLPGTAVGHKRPKNAKKNM